jgi:6-phosphofructokinase
VAVCTLEETVAENVAGAGLEGFVALGGDNSKMTEFARVYNHKQT